MRPVRWILRGGGLLFGAGVVAAYRSRSYPSLHVELHEHEAQVPEADKETIAKQVEKKLMLFAGGVMMGSVGSLAAQVLKAAETTDLLDRELLWKYAKSDRDGRPLVTVSNHGSVLDDPFIMSYMTPLSVLLQPSRMRFGVCSEELCFGQPALSTFFGLGNGIPIQRGGTIHQQAIARLLHRANHGGWVHLFSEGRVWQETGNPLRDEHGRWCSPSGRCNEPYSHVGPLKWGVGKIIANAKRTPIIVPVFHMGMEWVMPQDHHNQLVGLVPYTGHHVTVGVGDTVDVQDLIDAYYKDAAERARLRAASPVGACGVTPPDHDVHVLSQDGGVVPSRKNLFGVVVPAYREEPLRIKPPDHDRLSESEAVVEERFRLELYSQVCRKVWHGLHAAEHKVRKFRADKYGLQHLDDAYLYMDVDSKPMK